jgi:hypothetical protein
LHTGMCTLHSCSNAIALPRPLSAHTLLVWKEITNTSLCGSLSRSPSQACFRVSPPTTAQSPVSDPSIHPSVHPSDLSIVIRFHRLALWTIWMTLFFGKYNGMVRPPGPLCWVRCQASPFIHPFILSIAIRLRQLALWANWMDAFHSHSTEWSSACSLCWVKCQVSLC